MKFNDLKLGMRVKVNLDCESTDCDFSYANDGLFGIVEEIDDDDEKLSVFVCFDNDRRDWGNHRSLVAAGSEKEKIDKGTISDKLAEIERLVKEVKEML